MCRRERSSELPLWLRGNLQEMDRGSDEMNCELVAAPLASRQTSRCHCCTLPSCSSAEARLATPPAVKTDAVHTPLSRKQKKT